MPINPLKAYARAVQSPSPIGSGIGNESLLKFLS